MRAPYDHPTFSHHASRPHCLVLTLPESETRAPTIPFHRAPTGCRAGGEASHGRTCSDPDTLRPPLAANHPPPAAGAMPTATPPEPPRARPPSRGVTRARAPPPAATRGAPRFPRDKAMRERGVPSSSQSRRARHGRGRRENMMATKRLRCFSSGCELAPWVVSLALLSPGHPINGQSIKSSNGKSPIVVGPWGGTGGYPWDDGVYSTIRQVVITHGAAIDSIRIEYDLKGNSVWSDTHGSADGDTETDKVKLDFPDEILVSVSGYYGSVCGTPVIIRSLTFQSNRSKYGPFGTEDGTPFSLPVSSGKIIGFHGRSGSYLNSIGFYLKQVHVPNPSNSPASPQSQRLSSPYNRNGYSYAEDNTGHDMALIVRDRGDSYTVYTSNYPKQQYTNSSPDYNDGALWNKMVSFPSSYGEKGPAAINSPETYGPWGGSGGTIFDDGVYTGVWQINLTRAVGISSMKVLYDRNGQAVWGNKHGFSGGVTPDKIAFDFPSEVLTHITGFYGSTMIMGPTVIRSLTFHTNRRRYGPYGDEYGTYFSTSFTNGRVVGFHGREGWYIDGIGVHVQEGKLAPQRVSSRPAAAMNPSLRYNMLAQAQSEMDDEVAYGSMVKEPIPMGPGPWGGEGGRPWDDGVYAGVKQIYIMRGAFIGSMQIEYDRGDQSIWSARHGTSGHITNRIKLDYPHEVLTCIYGYYNTNREEGPRVLRSITFISNRGKYGPFGDEVGAFFSSATTAEGKVVGFHGRSGQHLDAIGVHMQHWMGGRRPAPKYVLSKYLF